MAVLTYAEQLEHVQAAIQKIEAGGQSYTVQDGDGGVTYTRADLRTLYEREERLLGLVARGGGMRVRLGRPL